MARQRKFSSKLETKPGYSVNSIIGADPEWKDARLTSMWIDGEVIDSVKKLFPGQMSMLVNIFLREVIKKRPRIIFDMPFERPDAVEQNPFNRPNLICQCKRHSKQVIARYATLFDAQQATGIAFQNIRAVCDRKPGKHTAGGFFWCYEDDLSDLT